MTKMFAVTAAALAVLAADPASAADHYNKYSAAIHAHDGGGCVTFRLEGVTTADPTVPSGQWLALATNHPNFSSLYSMLLSANLGRRTMTVSTHGNGTLVCVVASVRQIGLD